ncbi:PBECR2 nuclease fold domain-containing protein [Helicobacter himalayensis]|uniref:putative barnase/colicin E5 family endoribonuclease n=1 Tax=Helicobacter himalayensis TaxID=1591088 RepID=UPI00214F7AC7|nr:PBECR2 nuclease fold domain-containing protein [Helicobacter himalayensis]
MPNFELEVKEALSPILKDKEIRLGKGSFIKLYQRDRLEFLPFIKETLENPNVIVKQVDGALIFAKTLKEKIFFVNVSRDYAESFKGLSLAPKKEANLINKLEHAKEVIYNALDSKLRDSTAQQAFTDVLSSANKSNEDILPQKTSDSLTKQEESLRALLTNFRKANSEYADIKKRLNDKLTKAIFLDKPKKSTINSMRSIEEWKNAVLDKQWVNSIQGLENTIFAKFNPQMQEATQTLMIFRALERHIKSNNGISTINLSKALKDIESLEALPLHPKAQNALNIFKELANIYQFANKISGAKGYKSASGNGALSTTLEGRARVFLTNKLFKGLFFRVPYIGDKDAVLFHLKKAVRELKYPRAITLDILDNPTFTTPSPKSPINPKGEAFINDEVKRDISEFASNESVLKDEIIHKRAEIESQNTELLNAGEVLQALQKDKVIYSKVGSGSVTKEDLAEIQSILKELERREGIIADFGTNYAEFYHKGAEALKHLLSTKEGQVQGAFYRKDLEELSGSGDISIVWGEITDKANHKGYGLAHIIDKHGSEFENIPQRLNEIITQGEIEKDRLGRLTIKKDGFRVGLKANWKGKPTNKWIVTAYYDEKSLSLSTASDFTKGETLPFNSKEIITQQELTHNTPKVFDMGEIKINDYDDFLYYAKLAGFDLSKNKNAKEIHKALLAQIDKLEC